MIATVTLNPSLDRTITVNGLVIDETNRWISTRLYAGGKGIDVSRAIHEMGGKTVAYGFVGGVAGRTVEILLDEEGVPFSFTPIEQETRTNYIISDTSTGRQTRIDAPGPRISKREFERFHSKMRRISPRPELMVVGGSIPPGLSGETYYDIISEAKDFGIRCMLDSEGKWLEAGIKAGPFLVKSNVHETEMLVDREIPDEAAIVEVARSLVGGGTDIAVITQGKDGIIAATGDEVIKAVPPEVKVKSTVGAGDCLIAGMAIKMARGKQLLEACRLATAMGTACVLTPGTELCHRADVERLLPQIMVWQMSDGEWHSVE
ncbi:MAG TPA: 1-phosphofructokinase [Dehalococcoidia bacterium]|nr:1-phosphofructokinase [Dehalococcoidia bacterium]